MYSICHTRGMLNKLFSHCKQFVSTYLAGASLTAFSQSLSKWGIWEWCILIIWLLSALVLGNSWSHIPHLNLSICQCIFKTTNVFWRSSQSRPYSQFSDRYDENWLQGSQIKIYYIILIYLSQVLSRSLLWNPLWSWSFGHCPNLL